MAPKKAPPKKGPGIGGGKRGQRLRASAAAYVSPNIGGVQPTGDLYGAYDSGDTMMQTKRNEWLNTLSIEDRERAINQMGYWTGGKPVATPKTSKKTIRSYANQGGHTAPGTYLYGRGSGSAGPVSGSFEIGADGNLVKGSVTTYRKSTPKKGPTKKEAKVTVSEKKYISKAKSPAQKKRRRKQARRRSL